MTTTTATRSELEIRVARISARAAGEGAQSGFARVDAPVRRLPLDA